MENIKYVAADVHAATTTFCVRDATGRIVSEAITETKAGNLVAFVKAQPGRVHLTFEEGTQASWLYDLLLPYVAELIVCDPRKNKLLGDGNKSDKIDTRKLSDLLRGGFLKPVYHGERSIRHLKQLVMAHQNLVRDHVSVQLRIQAVYRGRGLSTTAIALDDLDAVRERLAQLKHRGTRHRAELLYRQLYALDELRNEAERAMLVESRRHRASKLLRTVPGIGDIRAAQFVAVVQTPHRFRTKRQLWKYAGLAVVNRTSSDYAVVDGEFQRKKQTSPRGLNRNYNRMLKGVLKGAALDASCRGRVSLKDYYKTLIDSGTKPEMARLTLARKIGAISLAIWKKGDRYDANKALTRAT